MCILAIFVLFGQNEQKLTSVCLRHIQVMTLKQMVVHARTAHKDAPGKDPIECEVCVCVNVCVCACMCVCVCVCEREEME